jgi:uncharacterized protein YyaL (SSP411 family)
MTNEEVNNNEENNLVWLKEGDKFTVDAIKYIPSKKYNSRVNAKILTLEGAVYWTSAANIITALMAVETPAAGTFTVFKSGSYNGHPVLSVRSDDIEVQHAITRALF